MTIMSGRRALFPDMRRARITPAAFEAAQDPGVYWKAARIWVTGR
jgi:hypothetical protein